MHILYVDESGCLGGLPSAPSEIQPALCVAGLVVPQRAIQQLTRDWMAVKQRYFPGLCGVGAAKYDWHRAEVKGSSLRKAFRDGAGGRTLQRHAMGFLDRSLELIEKHEARLMARVWIKPPGGEFKGHAVYTASVQWLCKGFNAILEEEESHGLVIADSRMPGPNSQVSHSVFTQKYRKRGDPFPRIVEAPVFGHSDNHAGLQITDLITSAVLYPVCVEFFLRGRHTSSHAHIARQAIHPPCRRIESVPEVRAHHI